MKTASEQATKRNEQSHPRCIVFYTSRELTRIEAAPNPSASERRDGEKPFGCLGVRPDESDRRRWIATNRGKRAIFVQQPGFFSTRVAKINPGCSIALVEGSRIAVSPHSTWINVACG